MKIITLCLAGLLTAFLLKAEEEPPATAPVKVNSPYRVIMAPNPNNEPIQETRRKALEAELNKLSKEGYQFAGMNDDLIVMELRASPQTQAKTSPQSGRRRVVLPPP